MGTAQIKELAKNSKDGHPGLPTMKPQMLDLDKLMEGLIEKCIKKEGIEEIFNISNVQKNKNVESNFVNNAIQKFCNDQNLSGFATSEYVCKLLSEASHEKYFRVHTDAETAKYTSLATGKIAFLHIIYMNKSEGKGTQQGFFEYVEKFLSAETDDEKSRQQVGLNTGLRFSLSLLKELQKVSPQFLENSLQHLYEALCDAPSGSLFGTDLFAFQQDITLDEARDFLVQLIKSRASHSKTLVELSLKTIIRLGIVRSNPEDFLIAVNIINQDSELANSVDLRSEIINLPAKGIKTGSSTKGKISFTETKGILRQNLMSLLNLDMSVAMSEDLEVWTTDGDSFFINCPGLLKTNVPKNANDVVFKIDENNQMDPPFEMTSYICYLDGKIYVRDDKHTDTPLFIYDPVTLTQNKELTQSIKLSEEESATTMKVTDGYNKETGRKLGDGPLFTDGTFLYLVSQKKHIRPADLNQDEDLPTEPTALVIEQYCPKTYQHIKSVTLYKSENHIFHCKKQTDVDKYLRGSSFHTNGSHLMLANGKKRHFFNMETGIRIEKIMNDNFCPLIIHDLKNRKFYTFEKIEELTFLTDFTIPSFNSTESLVDDTKGSNLSPIEKIKETYLKGHVQNPIQNVIQRKMVKRNVVKAASISEAQPFNAGKLAAAILLDNIAANCENFDLSYKKFETESHTSENYLKLFHWPGTTYLTASLFDSIRVMLCYLRPLIAGIKIVDNLPEQISLLNVIKVLSTNMKALNYCGIKLPEILEEQSYNAFQNEFKDTILYLIEQGFSKEGSDMQICGIIWDEIYACCQTIMTFSIQLIYSDANSVLQTLADQLSDANMSEKKAENCAFSLQFLSSSSQIQKIFQHENRQGLKQIEVIIDSLNRIQTERQHKELKKIKLFETLPEITQPSLFAQACDSFEKIFFEELLVQLDLASLNLAKKQQNTIAGKLKRKQDEENCEQLVALISSVFSSLFDRQTSQYQMIHEHIIQTLDIKQQDFFTEDTCKQFKYYCKRLHLVVSPVQKIYLLNLYITSLSQFFGEHPSMISKITQRATEYVKITTSFIQFIQNESKKLIKLSEDNEQSDEEQLSIEDNNEFIQTIKTQIRRVCFLIGSISFSLINIKSEELTSEQLKEETPAQKMTRLMMDSKLLSGGIENRFMSTFTQETKDKLKNYLQINNNTQILEILEHQDTQNQEDLLLKQILKPGQNELADLLIKVLQYALEQPIQRCQYAKVGSEQGLQMSRTSFAVMLKYSQLTDIWEETIQELDIIKEQLEIENDLLKDCLKEIQNDENFKKLLSLWLQASKIRIWIVEKKNNLSEKIDKKQREIFIVQKRDQLKKAKDTKPKEEEKSLEPISTSDVLIQIDTKPVETEKPKEEEKKEEENEDEVEITLTTEDQAVIQAQVFSELDKELEERFSKIIAKAEYLIKMQVPSAYRAMTKSDDDQDVSFMKVPSYLAMEQERFNQEGKTEDWKEKLKKWKNANASKDKSKEKKQSDMFENGNTSVMACLQAPVTVAKIKQRTESHFLKACRRSAGLSVLAKVICLPVDVNVFLDLSNWFSSALRDRTNRLSHYFDEIKSCGNNLEQLVRSSFFVIIKSITKKIKQSKDKDVIIRLLDSLQWKFMGRDHSELLDTDIFRCLREGDGSRKHPIKLAWGKAIGLKTWQIDEAPTNLQFMLLETFENLFFNIVSRVTDQDLGAQIQLKKTGTAIPMIERSKSVLSTTISEQLIGQAFHILFKELNRYSLCLKEFPGIDYQSFVTLYNKIKVKNLKDNETIKIGDGFENELLFDLDEEEKQYQNQKKQKKEDQEAAEEQKDKETSEQKTEEQLIQQTAENITETTIETKEDILEAAIEETKEVEIEAKSDQSDDEDKEKTEALQKETEALEQIQAKIKENEENQSKVVHKIYSGLFLRRMLRLIEVFTNISKTQSNALVMVQRVANPYMIQILINLYTYSEPRNQVIVLKILQNLLTIGIPSEIFESTIQTMKAQGEIKHQAKSSLTFQSPFLEFWFNNLNKIRSAMFVETQIQSTGSYEVSQEISRMISTILAYYSTHYATWCQEIKENIARACLQIQKLSNVDRDVVFSVMQGTDFNRPTVGSLAVTEENQLLTVLGYRQSPKEGEQKATSLNPTFSNDQDLLIGLYFNQDNKAQQEIVEVQPHNVKTLISFDNEVQLLLAQQSVLKQPEILKAFVDILSDEKSSKELQVQILKAIAKMLSIMKTEFLEQLKDAGMLKNILNYLFKAKLEKKVKDSSAVIPVSWLEARIANIKVNAIENAKTLQKNFDMKCQVLKKRQLVFTHLDKDSGNMVGQNAPLLSSINLHKVNDNSKYFVNLSQDPSSLSQTQICKQQLTFIEAEKFNTLDNDVFKLMKGSEAVITHDAQVRQIIVSIAQKAKEYSDAENKQGLEDWSQVFSCIVFVVKKNNFINIRSSQERSFYPHNGLEITKQNSDSFEQFKSELKSWGGIDLDLEALMYHIAMIEEKSLAELKGKLPEILQKVELEEQELKDVYQRLEAEGATQKLQAEKERQLTILEERRKKIAELQGNNQAFKEVITGSTVERLIKNFVENEVIIDKECEIYDLLNCKKEYLTNIDKLIETQFKEKVDANDSQKMKSDKEKAKMYLSAITGFDKNDLLKSYETTFSQLLGEYASQTLLEILNNSDLNVLLPIMLKDKATQKQLSCFLKSSFSSAVKTFNSTGQKFEIKQVKRLIRNLFQCCLSSESADYIHQFLKEEIILPGIQTLKKLESEKASISINKYFTSEDDAIENLHPALLHFILQLSLEFRLEILIQSKSYLPTLMGLALGMFVKFWVASESQIPMKLLQVCMNIVFFTQEYLDHFLKTNVVSKIINSPIITHIIQQIDYTQESFSEVQKLLLEVYLAIINLKDLAEQKTKLSIDSILQITPGISQAKRSLRIVKEKQEFKFLTYFIHQQALSPNISKQLNQYFGVMHPHLDVKIRAKYSINEVERIQFKANEKSEMKPFTFVGISQTHDGKNMQLFSKENFKEKDGITQFNSSHFYVFYPVKKQVVISMGVNKRNRMTNNSASDVPYFIKSTQDFNTVKVVCSRNSTFIMTETNELYQTGEKYGASHDNFTLMKMPKTEVPSKIFCGRKCKFVIDTVGKTFFSGESEEFELPNNTTSASLKEFKLSNDESNTEKIVDIACGHSYNLFVTDKGKLWATGRKFLKRVGLDSEVPINITLPQISQGTPFVMRAWASSAKDEQMALIMIKTNTDEIQLWSIGKNESGALGQGGLIKESKVFGKVSYDSSVIKFTEISLFSSHVMAIDQDGILWSWGSNLQGRAGHPIDIENQFKPIPVAVFVELGLKAVQISAGKNHSLVLAKEQNGSTRLYSIGKDDTNYKILGCTQVQAGESLIRKINLLQDLDIVDFSASSLYSMIIMKGEKDPGVDGLYEHKISEEKIVKGVLHAYKKDEKWFFMSEEEYQIQKLSLPDVCLAFKCPIPNMEKLLENYQPLQLDLQSLVSLEQTENINSSQTGLKIEGAVYTASAKIGGDDLKVNLCEDDIINSTTQFDLHPLIFFRLTKPLKQGSRLPVLDLKQIYQQTTKFGFDLEVTPDFSYVENQKLLNNTAEQFKEYTDQLNKFPVEGYKELFQQMDKQLKVLEGEIELKGFDKFIVKDMTFKEEKDEGKLFKISNIVKEKRVNLIWHYNYFFCKLQKYLLSKPSKGFKGQKVENTSATNIFNQVKHLILGSVKMNFVDKAIEKLSCGSQTSVNIDRNDALRFEESGRIDHSGEYTVFGQIFTQMAGNYEMWKQNKPDDQALRVNFSGESAIDAGGPYRETLSNFIKELESGVLPLIVKTTNNKTNHGDFRDCFIVNSQSVTPTHQQLFKFLGVLIGYAFRSKSCMPFNMAPVFWKQLIGEKLVESDLTSVDTYTSQTFRTLRINAKKIQSQEEFETIVDQSFVITVDGKDIELCLDGKERKLNQSNIEEFIKLVCEKKFSEGIQQIKWIREGMNIIIPDNIVSIVSWYDVEDRVAGMKIVDVAKLKSITEYRSCDESTKVVKLFWNVLERLSDEDKTAYLKFVWGRARMPFDCTTLRYKHRIAVIDHWEKDRLPESHTCFFAIDIPVYETEEILEKKLLTSIRFCGEIDND